MKDQVKNMFAEITMPEDSARRIRRAMAEKQAGQTAQRPRRRPAAAVAVVLSVLLLVGLGLNTQVRAAVENLVKRYVFHNGTTVIEKREDGMSGISTLTNVSDCLEARDGRLYLIANGENRDITDETSMEKPYFYTYVDDQAVKHLLILGGTPDNYGYHEFYREDSGQGDWLGGEGANYLDMETEKPYPWLVNAWENLNIPWPLPGDNG